MKRTFLILISILINTSAVYASGIWNSVVTGGNARLGSYTHLKYPTDPSNTGSKHTHLGVDILAREGTPIHAMADGIVHDVIDSSRGTNFNTLGYMVIIRHPRLGRNNTDLYSLYLHMKNAPSVGETDSVNTGDIIGYIGKTGASGGTPHTHFEIRYFSSRFSAYGNIYALNRDAGNESYAKNNWEDPEKFVLARETGSTTFSTGSYSNNQNVTQTLSISGASALTVRVNGVTESGYDWITIFSSNGQLVKKLSGSINENFIVNGSSIRVNFQSDSSVTESGATVTISRSTGVVVNNPLPAPDLSSPSHGATVSTNQSFYWDGVPDATVYRIVVSTQSNFSNYSDSHSNPCTNSTCWTDITTSTYYSGFNLAEGTIYYWRVRAGNNNKGGEWSDSRRFTTKNSTTSIPTAVRYIDQCISKFSNSFGTKDGSAEVCFGDFYCQDTTGRIVRIAVHKSERDVFWYLWSPGNGEWNTENLSSCN
jgi:hypothetical protein